MNGRLEARLTRLEQRSGATWAHLAGVPMRQWPDEALEALICDQAEEPRRHLTDAELLAIIAKRGA